MDSKVKVLEKRVWELEKALDIEKRQAMESHRNIYKRDRKIKDLTLEAETAKMQCKDLQVTLDNLQSELRIYKRKFEDVAEVSNLNQNRFRKVHGMYLEECGRTEQFESQLRRKRAVEERTSLFHQA